MDQLKKILEKTGLSETEADIYLACLPYSSIGVKEIEKNTGINRTTIYHALGTLMKKGLASKVKNGNSAKLLFTMSNPENIRKVIQGDMKKLEERKAEIESIIPLLLDRSSREEEEFKVSHYEGLEGMKIVVEEALYCKSREWKIIAPRNNFFSEFDKAYSDYYLRVRRERGIKAMSLWERSPEWRVLSKEEAAERNPRYLPEEMSGLFKSVIILFDDKTVFISSLKNLSAILVQSKEINSTLTALFTGLWTNAESML